MKTASILLAAAALIAPIAAAAQAPRDPFVQGVEQSQAARHAEVQRARRTLLRRLDLAAKRTELMRNVLQMVGKNVAARIRDGETETASAIIAVAE